MSENEREISNAMKKKLEPMIKLSEALNNREILPIIDLQKSRDNLLKENIKQLKKLNNNSKSKPQPETIEFTNPFEAIFANSKSYQLFEKLHSYYKDDTIHFLANYSHIYYAMENDKYIICPHLKYIDFLNDNYLITIPKVDSKQSGKTKKSQLYNALKETIFPSKK